MTSQDDIDFENTPNAKHILIVEDDKNDMLLIVKKVKEAYPQAKIIPTSSLFEAYKTYRQMSVDLVLLDLNLPDGYGPSTVAEMRQFSRRTPIIVLTTMGNELTVREAMKNGANHFFLKSDILTDTFRETLQNYMN